MKTAISIPDELFRQADELATRLGKSRSELYREALADYLSRRAADAVTEALDAVVDAHHDEVEPLAAPAARRVLQDSEW